MAVALGTTLLNLEIGSILYKGQWDRIIDRKTNGIDIFIGAAVTEFGEATHSDIDLCAEIEAILGFVLGYNPQENTIDTEGYLYRDYDNPFGNNKLVRVGVPRQGIEFYVLSGTNKTIAKGAKIKCVDGVFETADTNDNYQMIAMQAVTGASSTRKYFIARWVKN